MKKAGLPDEILFKCASLFLKGYESLSIGLENFNTLVTDPSGIKTDLDENADKAKVRIPLCRTCVFKKKMFGHRQKLYWYMGPAKIYFSGKKKKHLHLAKKYFSPTMKDVLLKYSKAKFPLQRLRYWSWRKYNFMSWLFGRQCRYSCRWKSYKEKNCRENF